MKFIEVSLLRIQSNKKNKLMDILINTDKTLKSEKRLHDFFSSQIAEELDRFASHISRIEVHLKDENGKKEGHNDITCVLEARMEGKQPIAVTSQAGSIEAAVSASISKIKASLTTIIGREKNHA